MTDRDAVLIVDKVRQLYQTDLIQISSCAKIARSESGDWIEAWIWLPKEEEPDVSKNVVPIFKNKKLKTVPSSTPEDSA